jgi:hypothetical protein
MIKSIIFSKNRPLQLDLTLSSIKENFISRGSVSVICYIDDPYIESYKRVESEHPDIKFINEKLHSGHLLDIVIEEIINGEKYVSFFTDDIIFYQEFNYSSNDLNDIFSIQSMACLSLRLGINTILRNAEQNIQDNIPEVYRHENGLLIWDRLSIPPGGYWAYPLSVDGHIFEKGKILPIIRAIDKIQTHVYPSQRSPNKLEELMQMFFFHVPNLMSCPEYSCIVNSPNNRVQNVILNQYGNKFNHSPSDLLDLYMGGHRIQLSDLNINNIKCPHTEIKLV